MTLSTEDQSARMSKIKNGGLDQYGSEPEGLILRNNYNAVAKLCQKLEQK